MEYRTASDCVLMQLCQSDDIKAYNELFDRYVSKLHRMGKRYLKDEELVEELVMDILLNLWDRRNEIQLFSNLSSYLFGAMYNKAMSQLRKQSPKKTDIQAFDTDSFVAEAATDQGLILKEAEAHYEQLLGQLSPQRRAAFRLSREEGMSYADIAQEMNLSINTVKNHISAALDYLRQNYRTVTYTPLLGLLISIFR